MFCIYDIVLDMITEQSPEDDYSDEQNGENVQDIDESVHAFDPDDILGERQENFCN